MSDPSVGPLGDLSGLTWDPIRKKYFPTPRETPSGPSRDRDDPIPLSTPASKRPKAELPLRAHRDVEAGGLSMDYTAMKGKRRRLGGFRGYGQQDRGAMSTGDHLASLAYEGLDTGCSCRSERITTLQTFTGGAYLAATDGGKVMMQDLDGTTHRIGVCSDPLVGLHYDIARMTIMTVSAGDDPHLHLFKRDDDSVDQLAATTFDLKGLADKEIKCVASYDDLTVGSNKSLTSVTDYENPLTVSRALISDPLCMDFGDNPNIVYTGLRNAKVLMTDLRTPTSQAAALCRVPGGKAVIGVKRLDDGAVPFGLVASAMGNELLIYDTRFGSSPLHTLPDHINKFNFPLDLAVTPDSKFLFASGSDRRIGLWSTITGERIHPTSEDEPPGPSSNPLKRIFPGMVQKLAVREDYGLLVGCGAEVMHFGKARPGRGRRDFGHGSGGDDSEESMDEDGEDEMAQRVRLEELD